MVGEEEQFREWVVRWKAGDESALWQLFDHFRARLQGLIQRIMKKEVRWVRRSAEPEDMFDGAEVRLADYLLRVPEPPTTREFLKAASWAMRQELRAMAHHDRREEIDDIPSQDHGNGLSDPDYWTEFHENAERLPEQLRETFDLLWYQGLTQSEAATILGLSRGKVGLRWRKALELLRQQPRDTAHPDEDQWERLDKRRIELIDKEAEVGLSEDELSELERLQKETGRYLNLIAPLPFETLERFEERARRAGIPLDQQEAGSS